MYQLGLILVIITLFWEYDKIAENNLINTSSQTFIEAIKTDLVSVLSTHQFTDRLPASTRPSVVATSFAMRFQKHDRTVLFTV